MITYKKILTLLLQGACLTLVMFQVYCGQSSPSPQTACGFKQNSDGQRISLKANLPLKMYFDSNFPTQYRQAVINAMDIWNKAAGKVLFTLVGDIVSNGAAHDSLNVIYWEASWDQSSQTSQAEQANTNTWWSDNEIIEADIVINGQNYSYSVADTTPTTSVDVESLAIHEFGHALGLVHITDQPSVMSPKLDDGVQRRTLMAIDSSNLQCEY